MEWAVFRIHPAELWAGQAACTHSQEAGLAWLHRGASPSPCWAPAAITDGNGAAGI